VLSIASFSADPMGAAPTTTPDSFAVARGDGGIAPGSSGASLLQELGPEPSDLVLTRWHGVGTDGGNRSRFGAAESGRVDHRRRRSLGDVAITNFVTDAVNAAYQVVLPRDAVAGIPADYASAVIANTLSLLATVTTTDTLIDAWKQH
jgi:hypothetical protein